MSTAPVTIRPYRAIIGSPFAPIIADAVIEEHHGDRLTITDHPVEKGSVISDHAYINPSSVSLEYVWSAGSTQNKTKDQSFLKTVYNQLLQLYQQRTLLTIYTGKRTYTSMLIEELSVTTDKTSENSLVVRISCREVIIVSSVTATISQQDVQTLPQKTAPVTDNGQQQLVPGNNFNPALASGPQ